MNGLLQDKVALITGAASGIGRASAQLFARQGAQVVVADISEAAGEETASAIRAEGGEAIFVRTDVGVMGEVGALVEKTVAQYGRLDVIFSNAAAYSRGDAVEQDEAGWDRTLAVCLKASWMLAHFGAPHMLAGRGGAMVITGSVHSIRGYAGHAAYQATKGGLLSLTRAMAADFAPTIRVNCILPGAVMTGMSAHLTEQQRRKLAESVPLKRIGEPDDIAQAALFLASSMSAYITGTSILVDGGMTSIIEVPEGL
jgi:NAD(P)-dependent dehydrogenase (short-subunit alcohol dehydrogenase family)